MIVDTFAEAGIEVLGDDAGAHVVVLLPSAERERDVMRQALEKGLRVDGLGRHYVNRPRWHGLAIGYSACSREQLISALPVLTELVSRGNRPNG